MRAVRSGVVAVLLASALGCAADDEWAGWESREIVGGAWIGRSADGTFCVARDPRLDLLCVASRGAAEIGWDERYVAVRIDVPGKEFLLLDRFERRVWVLDQDAFVERPEARGIRMVQVERAWRELSADAAASSMGAAWRRS